MKMTFRWYGIDDPVTLDKIRQIPGMTGVVSAIYHIPVGSVWPSEEIRDLKEMINKHGLELKVIESVPVHEDIKLGLPTRDKLIKNYKETIRNLGAEGIEVICYNFMPVFDWTRSKLDHELSDGSKALVYYKEHVDKMNPLKGELDLPGWDTSYSREDIEDLFNLYSKITEEDLWMNLEYFLKEIIPAAEESNVKMAIHPDDPPWSIFGLPRIITDEAALDRLCKLVDSPYNGLTLCSGSLGVAKENDVPALVEKFASIGRIHFAHLRNVKIVGEGSFEEASHLSKDGSLDMVKILKAYNDNGFKGYIRPDHGRMIWGEKGKPGYGLYDRALGAAYINGIWETLKAR